MSATVCWHASNTVYQPVTWTKLQSITIAQKLGMANTVVVYAANPTAGALLYGLIQLT